MLVRLSKVVVNRVGFALVNQLTNGKVARHWDWVIFLGTFGAGNGAKVRPGNVIVERKVSVKVRKSGCVR